MYLLTYFYEGVESVGFLNDKNTSIIPASKVFKVDNIDMIGIIELFNNIDLEELRQSISSVNEKIKLSDVKILSPIPYPKRNVICLGNNYLDHVNEIENENIPEKPIYFSKIAYPAIGHEEFVDSHYSVVKELDYEAELAVIIGRKCKNVSKEEAEGVIFGYTISNDISAREIQASHFQWHKGKSFDTFCSIGPYIAYKSGFSFPPKLKIQCYVNNELRQNGNTSDLIFDIPTIISDITQGITLHPGDIILTGTPSGVGEGHNPPKYLKPGDIVDCVIEKIGTLSNKIK